VLEVFDLESVMTQWKGYYFIAVNRTSDNKQYGIMFFFHDNGSTFSWPIDDWKMLQSLFWRAWQSPEVAAAWDILSYEYGEL